MSHHNDDQFPFCSITLLITFVISNTGRVSAKVFRNVLVVRGGLHHRSTLHSYICAWDEVSIKWSTSKDLHRICFEISACQYSLPFHRNKSIEEIQAIFRSKGNIQSREIHLTKWWNNFGKYVTLSYHSILLQGRKDLGNILALATPWTVSPELHFK